MTEADFLKANGWPVPEGTPPATYPAPGTVYEPAATSFPAGRIVTPPEVPGPLDPDKRGLQAADLSAEEWREYEFGELTQRVTVRIASPKTMYYRRGGTTHRVVDSEGVVWCVPVPGAFGCVLRWKVKPGQPEVQF